MFFDQPNEIMDIAKKTGTAIFVVPNSVEIKIKNALILAPETKTVITIEQAREMMSRLNMRQTSDQYIIIRPAEAMSEETANALLKSLEEPGEKVHFLLVTEQPSAILPTILSRSAIYFLRDIRPVDGDIDADAKIKDLAKRLIVAKPNDLPGLAEEITKKKDNVREYALKVLSITIEMLYKSYFKTDKDIFIKKLPKFLNAYDNINKNGHIKLHLVADLC